MLRRPLALGFAAVYAPLPLYPAFIALTSVAYPGVSVVPLPVTLAILALIGVLIAYACALLIVYPKPGSQPLLVPMLTVFCSALLASLVGFDPLRGLLFVGIFGSGILWHCAIVRFYGEPHVAGAIFWSYLLSGTLAAAVAVAMVVARTPASLYALQHGRATGTFVLPGELAAYLVALLPLAFALTRAGGSRALRGLAWVGLGVGLVALALTYSRAGWMGAAAAAAFLSAAGTRGLRHARTFALASVGVGMLAVLVLFNSHHDPSEDYTRLAIWQAALHIINRFPLTGVGPFDFPKLYALVHVPDADATAFHAHSLYLTFLAEGGILMLAAFAWLGWRFAAELRARLALGRPAAATVSLAVTAGLVGMAVQGLIDTMSIAIFGLLLPAMGLALAAAQPNEPIAGQSPR